MNAVSTSEDAAVAPATALTTVVDLSRVKTSHDLPPSVAVDVGEIVSTQVWTWGETIRSQAPKQFGIAAVLGVAALLYPSGLLTSAALGGLVGAFFGMVQMKRQAPLLAAGEHLKSLGVGFWARRRIVKRLREIVGTFPAKDPAARPDGIKIAAMLNPAGEEMGRHAALPAPERATSLEEVPQGVARVVSEQHMVLRRRVSWSLGGFGLLMGGYAVSLVWSKAGWFAIMIVLILGLQGVFSWVLVRAMVKRQLRAPLVALGLTKAQADQGLKALGLARRALKRDLKNGKATLGGDDFIDALTLAWRERLGAAPGLPPASAINGPELERG